MKWYTDFTVTGYPRPHQAGQLDAESKVTALSVTCVVQAAASTESYILFRSTGSLSRTYGQEQLASTRQTKPGTTRKVRYVT